MGNGRIIKLKKHLKKGGAISGLFIGNHFYPNSQENHQDLYNCGSKVGVISDNLSNAYPVSVVITGSI